VLLRPSVPPAGPVDAEPPAEAGDGARAEEQGRGEAAPEARAHPVAPPRGPRRRRPAPTGETKARNLHLTDDIHDRLWMLARQRKTTVSAVAGELLDKALPRWKVAREG
jgi:hypothetical protein